MKATYRSLTGEPFTVEYDPAAPCRCCGEPVGEASVGGTDLCPACDCGVCRYCHRPFTFREITDPNKIREHVRKCKP